VVERYYSPDVIWGLKRTNRIVTSKQNRTFERLEDQDVFDSIFGDRVNTSRQSDRGTLYSLADQMPPGSKTHKYKLPSLN
jgi:hypothetical protein